MNKYSLADRSVTEETSELSCANDHGGRWEIAGQIEPINLVTRLHRPRTLTYYEQHGPRLLTETFYHLYDQLAP